VRLCWIPNAGHYLPHERPVEVANICQYAIVTVRKAQDSR
jgi:hypothetical protein